jgi:hypothetical protein
MAENVVLLYSKGVARWRVGDGRIDKVERLGMLEMGEKRLEKAEHRLKRENVKKGRQMWQKK